MSGKLVHYRPDPAAKPSSRTDWTRLEQMTDEEIDRAARGEPDAQPLSPEELAEAFRPGAIAALRQRLNLSQSEFAHEFSLSLRTLQDWEQGRRAPDHIARLYLGVIARNPRAAREVAAEAQKFAAEAATAGDDSHVRLKATSRSRPQRAQPVKATKAPNARAANLRLPGLGFDTGLGVRHRKKSKLGATPTPRKRAKAGQ
jgi:putative transcriptional regulator